MGGAGSGNAGEAMVLATLVRHGYRVLIPFGEGHPYDLAIHIGGPDVVRVQCKTARSQRGCIFFNPHTTDHGRGRLSYVGRAEVFGVYFPPKGSVYLVPVDAVTTFSGRLRVAPTRNNQKRGIRFAADFGIERWSLQRLRELVLRGRPEKEPLAPVA